MKKLFASLILTTTILFCMAACHKTEEEIPAVKKTFVLVHGAWQAPYAWKAVKEQLEQKGYKVLVVELPGHGADQTAPATLTMDTYRDKVISVISQANTKVILVGHSMGGMVITAVAEKIPDQIEKLVYIGAFLPTSGQSLLELSMLDKQSQLGASIVPSADQLTLDIKRDNIVSIFCQDASPEIQKLVTDNFRVEPSIPFTNKVTITDGNFGKVNKFYIRTSQDHAIGIDQQNEMLTKAKITNVFSVETGHCPFLSKPTEITDLLLKIVK